MTGLRKLQNTVAGGAIIIALFSIFSRALGLIRDRLLSSTFGAGEVLDAYYAAFRLPDLVFNTLILGALSAAFIPVFLQLWHQDKAKAWQITNSILNLLLVFIFFFAIFAFAFAPIFIRLLVPGFSPENQLLTVKLTRIMLVSILFFTISNIASSVLNSFRRWISYSLAPLMYNLGIIFGILLIRYYGVGLMGLAWGVVLGSILHLIVQLPSLFRTGFRWQAVFGFKDKFVRKIVLLMAPRCFALGIRQFNLVMTTVIASGIGIGAITVYTLAFNLVSFPVSIFGISLAISVFPVLSQCFVKREFKELSHHFTKTVRRIFYLTIPTTVLIILLRTQLVRLLLGAGLFGWQDTILTANALGWFAISLFAQSLIPIIARAFYAVQDTKTPVKIALIAFATNLIGCLILGRLMGPPGLALALSISAIVNFVFLYFAFRNKVHGLRHQEVFWSLMRIVPLSIIMGLLVQLLKSVLGNLVDMQTFVGVLIQTVGALTIGGAFYLIISLWFNFKEISILKEVFKKIF